MEKQKVLFLTVYSFKSLNDGYIFADLVKEFRDAGHDVSVAMAIEGAAKSEVIADEGITKIKVACGAIQKTSAVKKVLNLRKLDNATKKILKANFKDKFDLCVCMVSHCAFYKSAKFIKERDSAFIYNMVKDIFPQNAVDMGMLSKSGLKGLLYKYFKSKEQKYYSVCDKLGVLSPNAASFIIKDNPTLDASRVEINPNSIIPKTKVLSVDERQAIKDKYNIPNDKTVFAYGGNLGIPQGIDFLLDVIKANEKNDNDAFFVIVGDGTQFEKVSAYFSEFNPKKAKLIKRLTTAEFEDLCLSADVGLVFLNKAFTVANYPSRTLSYMQARLPVLFAVDAACDAGLIAEQNGYGYSCISGELDKFMGFVDALAADKDKRENMGNIAYNYLCDNYSVNVSYNIIAKHMCKSTDAEINTRQDVQIKESVKQENNDTTDKNLETLEEKANV